VPSSGPPALPERDPRDYTPRHLVEKILRSKSALEGERKQVTVFFADVQRSTELSAELGPEGWHEILDGFFRILADGVHRFEGTVNQYTGDGIMALFGAPIAHEDHAQRACYAALHLRDELQVYAQELAREAGIDFQTRIGLNSGEVVVGKIGDNLRMDYTAQGQVVMLAKRMEEIAEHGRIFLTERTQRLVEGFLQLRDLGEFDVKGAPEPLRVYDLEGVGAMRTRLEVARSRGFSPFVGRAEEMEAFDAALAQAEEGHGQIVGVVGEAGVGKSRLCLEFVEGCRAKGIAIYEAHCPPHGKTVPLLALLELLRAYFGITKRDSNQAAREKITDRLTLLGRGSAEQLSLVFDFLEVSDPERTSPQMDPQARQQQLVSFVRGLVRAQGEREFAVFHVDDLHWIDRASDFFLAQLVEAVSDARAMLLVNFRPEYHADWLETASYRPLRLRPLGSDELGELLRGLLGSDPSVVDLYERIRERTAGNPLFSEEVVQSLVESGSLEGTKGAYRLVQPVEVLEIPSTVQAVLAARIDRLEERQKHVLHRAAVIGKNFSEQLLVRVAELPAADLTFALGALREAELIHEETLYPELEYAFKHPLTREVAYESQLSGSRSQVHGAVAQALEELHPDKPDEQAALLAHHFAEAGLAQRAVPYYRLAGERAKKHWSNLEAVAHLTRGLELITKLPDGGERTQQELALQLALGPSLQTTRGYGSPEVEQAYSRARTLCRQAGEKRQLIPALWGLWRASHERAQFETALDYADELVRVAESIREPALLLQAHHAQWTTRFSCGQLRGAWEHSERAIDIYRREDHHSQTFEYGSHDPGVCARSIGSWCLWLLGYPDQGLIRSREALELSESLSHPWTRAAALRGQAVFDQLRRDGSAARESAEALKSASRELGFAFFPPQATCARGWALTQGGRLEEGIALMREGVSATSEAMFVPYFLVLLAEACGMAGALDDALVDLEEARSRIHSFGPHFYEAELHRVRGQLLLQSGEQADESQAAFRLAIETARRQEGKSLELRAATSLANLWQRQGRKEEARALLAPVYDWFTEGFDTRDLKNAKALLEELA
jgi:predicted ATPase/class 3 adenylate cyclase